MSGRSIFDRGVKAAGRRRGLINVLLEGAVLVGALGVGLSLRLCVYEPVLIVSGSMVPNMRVGDRFLVDHRATLRQKWRRGDVVLFDKPSTWHGDEGEVLVKRVIAMPDEQMEVRESRMFINGKLLDEPYLAEKPDFDEIGPLLMGADQYFLCGDNRNYSDDSRTNGPVSEKYIRGRVCWQLWPLTQVGAIIDPSGMPRGTP